MDLVSPLTVVVGYVVTIMDFNNQVENKPEHKWVVLVLISNLITHTWRFPCCSTSFLDLLKKKIGWEGEGVGGIGSLGFSDTT